jgi:hypothetical protein
MPTELFSCILRAGMIAVTWRMITASPDFSAQIGAAEMPDRPTLP